MTEPNGILIYGELTPDYKLKPVVLQLVTKARELKPGIWNQRICVCVIGPRIRYDEIINELKEYGVDVVIIVSDDGYKEYNTERFTRAFYAIAQMFPPRIMLFGATNEGKEIGAYSATKFETGLTADCSDLSISDDNMLISTRPAFGGQLYAEIGCKTTPQCATVRENNFVAEKSYNDADVFFRWVDPDACELKTRKITSIKKTSEFRDLETAKIIVAGGKGACKDNGFNLVYMLAQRLGAAVGGSREAVEKGYVPKNKQIGQTGLFVSPDVYIAVGISGADQHLTAIKNSGKIIAINNDPDAPIFKSADVGIVGDLFNIIPDLIDSLDASENKEEQK